MTNRQTPPGRTSISWVVVVKPRGPHQCVTWLGSVHVSNTSSRGASKSRVTTSSRSAVGPAGSLLAAMLLSLSLQVVQVITQAVEALVPEAAVGLHPVRDVLESVRPQPAGPPLGRAAARDEARALEYLEVLR